MADVRQFEERDWSDPLVHPPTLSTVVAVLGCGAIVAVFLYHHLVLGPDARLLGYRIQRLEWLWLVSLWLLAAYVGLSTFRNPSAVLDFVRFLRRRPVVLLAGLVVCVFFFAGTLGTVVLAEPVPQFDERYRPPAFTSLYEGLVPGCTNPEGDRCWGTLAHPFGTLRMGEDVFYQLLYGARSLVQLSMVGVLLIVPVGVVVGTAGAYADGLVRRALIGLTETVKAIPALMVYLLAWQITGENSVFLLVLSFGLVSWGSVAAVVHSRTVSELSRQYVRSARANGAGPIEVIRWHLLPNVARTAIGAALLRVPLFIVYEATLTYDDYRTGAWLESDLTRISWGRLIGNHTHRFDPYWWPTTITLAVLVLTVLSVYVFADVLQDYIDPRLDSR